MKTLMFAAAALIAAAGSAHAGLGDFQLNQSQNFSGELSPFGPAFLTFDQFDDNGGLNVLKAVMIEFEASVSAQVTAENDNIAPAPEFGVQLTGFVTVDVPAPAPGQSSITGLVAQGAQSGGVAGTDGVPGSGPDFFDFGLIKDVASGDDLLLAGVDDLSAFIGNGTFDAEVGGQGGFSVTGASNSTINIINFGVSGNVRITYFYNIIPTPGAAALAGVAGLAGIRRRRSN